MWASKNISILIIFCLASIRFFGQNNISEIKYNAINWNTNNGLIWDRVNSMIKDKEGFLWITSEYGLNRFDGYRFINHFPDKTKSGTIVGIPFPALIEDSLKNIWIGTDKGLSRYDIKNDTFTNFIPDEITHRTAIIPFWAGMEEVYCMESLKSITAYNIYTLKKRTLVRLQVPEFWIKRYSVKYTVFDTVTNSIWALPATEDGLTQFSLPSGKMTHYKRRATKKVPHFFEQFSTETMRYDEKRNCIWINSQDGLIQFTLSNKQFDYTYTLHPMLNRKEYDHGAGLDIDQHGRIWLATQSNGVIIYDPANQSVTLPIKNPGLQKEVSEGNFSIYCDTDGMIWTSSFLKKGIYQLAPSRQPVHRYSSKDLHPTHWIGLIPSVVPANNGRLWIGSQDGLLILDQNTGSIQRLKESDMAGLKGKWINMMMIDTLIQKAWINAWTPNDPNAPDAIYQVDMPTKQCRIIIFKDTANQIIKPGNIVFYSAKAYKNGFIFLDSDHGIFYVDRDSAIARQVLAFSQNLMGVLVADSNKLIMGSRGTYSDINGKWISTPNLLDSIDWKALYYHNADRTFWVGGPRKLTHYDKDFRILKLYTEKDGLPALNVEYILADDFGNIWFANTAGAISRLNTKTGQIITLSEIDGFQKNFFQWQATFIKDATGVLYFAGQEGVDRIDPARMNTYPPSLVYIKSVEVNQKHLGLQTGINNLQQITLKYFQNTINIETGIIDYYSKGAARIRYKLGGIDENWEYAPAYYAIRWKALRPGNYRLVMQASNASNEFIGPEKVLQININPPFWQTDWFRISAAILLVAILYGIYRWRTALLRKQKRVLEQTVKERTAEVVAEKAEVEKQKTKSDELLLNILPSEVADELKEKGYTTAKSFDEVTILFSDIKGFTHVAEKLSAQELVKEIDTYFSAFDRIMQQYGLEKIKTIGDAYIAACGLHNETTGAAEKVIAAAINMQQIVEKFKTERIETKRPYFELRIGIHTGPVVAGVVGIKKFQYDIWGDTVNLAARMEQSGVPGKINISEITFKKISDKFNCVHRGKIEAKNKGDVDMYLVESEK